MGTKRLLLTGAAGRVGRLVRPLLQEHYALRVADLAPLAATANHDEVLQGDLADPSVAARAVQGVDGVVHLAGLVAPDVTFEDTLGPNYRALLALLEACRHGGVPRFVFASSHHVLGLHAPGLLAEEAVVAPDGFYGLSKAFGEAACQLYARRFGIRTTILRIGNADPEVVDGRRERLWVSARDLVQLIAIGLEHEAVRCEVFYGTSRCPDPFFANDAAARFGYQPQDQAAEHRAAHFRPWAALTAADGVKHVGGKFAAAPLPDPRTRTR
ncbi:MAG: NAD(P)-dependent oxidoreductase [Verrucomicrobia bacterium]|nr:NAD(P)-dependent oxidoreductase [Verrucomicrobiota bacterium]